MREPAFGKCYLQWCTEWMRDSEQGSNPTWASLEEHMRWVRESPPQTYGLSTQPAPRPRGRTVQGRDGKSAFRFSSLNFDVYVLLRKLEKSAYQIRVSKVFSGKVQTVPILRIGVKWSLLTLFNSTWELPQKWKRQLLSHVQLFGTPWIVARQAPLSTEVSRQEYWNG